MRLLITQTPSPLTLDAQNRRVFPAQISFEGYNTYPITVTDPFTPAEEAELEWYYERWLNFPFTDKIRAQHAAESIRVYGHDLFKQLFHNNVNLFADYKAQRNDPFTPAQEAELEWYYERRLNFPFTDKIRAQHAAASIRTYGHDLFIQLFHVDPNLYADYREQRGSRALALGLLQRGNTVGHGFDTGECDGA